MLVRAFLCLVLLVSSSTLFAAETARLKIPDFRHLQSKATESVDISIGPFLLWLATKISEDGESEEVLRGIEAVHVRSYQFDADNAYSKADIENVRKQLQGQLWKPLAEIRSKRDESNVDIFMAIENDAPVGLAIIAAEPREFTIVNIVGTIDLHHLGKVQGALGLPGGTIRTASRDD